MNIANPTSTPTFIVVSGLPASGKTTLAAQLGRARHGPLVPAVALRCNTEWPMPPGAFVELATSVRQRIGPATA